MEEDEKTYFLKLIKLGKVTPLRYISICCKEKYFYEKYEFSIWWKKYQGAAIMYKEHKMTKYFMIGITIYNTKLWIDIKYIGNNDKDTFNKFKLKMIDK